VEPRPRALVGVGERPAAPIAAPQRVPRQVQPASIGKPKPLSFLRNSRARLGRKKGT
jgi:hypothetical protein